VWNTTTHSWIASLPLPCTVKSSTTTPPRPPRWYTAPTPDVGTIDTRCPTSGHHRVAFVTCGRIVTMTTEGVRPCPIFAVLDLTVLVLDDPSLLGLEYPSFDPVEVVVVVLSRLSPSLDVFTSLLGPSCSVVVVASLLSSSCKPHDAVALTPLTKRTPPWSGTSRPVSASQNMTLA
jgi:hypothetical protein